MTEDELELIREREALAESQSGHAEHSQGSVTVLARTKTVGTYPTTARSFYAMETVAVLGEEAEGEDATTTPAGDTWYAANIGTAVPDSGTEVLVTFTPYRWTFQHD